MNWFNNLKIAQKILSLVFILLFFMGAIGFIGYKFTTDANKSLSSMYSDRLLPVLWLNVARNHANAINADLLSMIEEKDKSKINSLIADVQRRKLEANDSLSKYEKKHLDANERENFAQLKEEMAKYRQFRDVFIKLALNNQQKDAYKMYVANKGLFEAYTHKLRDLATHSATIADKINKQNEKTAKFACNVMLGALALALIIGIAIGLFISSMISNSIKLILEKVQKVADGDLNISNIDIKSKDEIGELNIEVNTMTDNLRSLIKNLIQSIEDILASSQQMSAASEQTAQGAQNISDNILIITNGSKSTIQNDNNQECIGYINKAIQFILNNTENTTKVSKETEENAKEGCEKAIKAINKINQIKTSSQDTSITINELGVLGSQIEIIVDLIKNMASQTNLLALNAAIEAARAGEHGKGFAVVAGEVKKLATESSEATDKITTMIKEIQTKTNKAVNSMDNEVAIVNEGVEIIKNIEEALKSILGASEKTSNHVYEISSEVDKVAKSADSVSRAMEDISAVTEEQAAGLEEISANTQSLAKIAENLGSQINTFKI